MTAKKKVVVKNRTQWADVMNQADGKGFGKGFTREQWRKFALWAEAREVVAIVKKERSILLAIRKKAKAKADKITASIKKEKSKMKKAAVK